MKLFIVPRAVRDSIPHERVRSAKLDPPNTPGYPVKFAATFKERYVIDEVNKEAAIDLIVSANRQENMWFLVLEKHDDWSLEYIVP